MAKLYEFRGETKTLEGWAEATGLPLRVVASRICEYNWPIEEALTLPAQRGLRRAHRDPNVGAKTRLITHQAETLTIGEWGEKLGLKWKTIYERLTKHGWSVEDALSPPRGPTIANLRRKTSDRHSAAALC